MPRAAASVWLHDPWKPTPVTCDHAEDKDTAAGSGPACCDQASSAGNTLHMRGIEFIPQAGGHEAEGTGSEDPSQGVGRCQAKQKELLASTAWRNSSPP